MKLDTLEQLYINELRDLYSRKAIAQSVAEDGKRGLIPRIERCF
jgi:hypothetical protein